MEDALIGMTPVAFGGCFGWLHQAAGGGRGVVLCAASGYEALGTHQSWRVLADRLAAVGLPTLRFDYPGCGDSLGDGGGPDATEASISSIRQAAEFLREQTGVSEVALIGLRLGAAFALEAALADNAVDSLALVTPVLRGKSFLLEQRALAKVIAARGGANTIEDFSADRISVEGFEFDRDAIDAIMKIDLQSIARPPARRILIVGEPGSGRYDAFAEKLKSFGCAVAGSQLSEVGAWRPSTIPTPAPLEDIKSIVDWAREGARERRARAVVATRGIETENFVESVLRFGEADRLVGVLCRPRTETKERGRPAMILLNTGANHHIGSGRTMVEHARFLAGQGHATLRMDCLGIGDSDWLPEGPLAVIHHEERAADVSQAIDALEAAGFDDISAAGVCSGAFLAFRSALKDVRIKRLLLVNPQFWLPLSSEQLADARQGTFGSTSTYLAKAVSLDAWRRVVDGQVGPGALLSILGEIAARGKKALMSRFPKLSVPRTRLESELSALGERGCQTLLVLGVSDSAREIFAEHMAAANMASLPEGLEIEMVQGADHAFATRDARWMFRRLLARIIRRDEHEPSAAGKESIFPNGRRNRFANSRSRESVSELVSKPM
ncbi:MAG TPA: alpha/beta fold hydrolase [Methylocystis sp.]